MYNVLNEKWIPVTNMAGVFSNISLKEAILDAHQYRGLNETDSLLECALYRFLFTFVSDMVFCCHSQDVDMTDLIEKYLDAGSFSEDDFTKYVEKCHNEGVSFDLFDEKKPFMQNADYEYTENDIMSVATLCCRKASGSNKLFHDHEPEAAASISYEEALKHLIASSPFAVPKGRAGGTNQFGALPPLFAYVEGDSLFETLVANLIKNEGNNRPLNVPYWRMNMKGVKSKEAIPPFSTYAAMMCPVRFVKLIPENGHINKIYYVIGYKIDKDREDILVDPYVMQIEKKDGEKFLFCPKVQSEVWKDISGVLDTKTAPAVINNYAEVANELELKTIQVIVYVTVMKNSKGTFAQTWKNQIRLPAEILEADNILLKTIKTAAERAETKCWAMLKAVEETLGKDDSKSIKPRMQESFYSTCGNKYFNDFLPNLKPDEKDNVELVNRWNEYIQNLASSIFDEFIIDKLTKMDDIHKAYQEKVRIFSKKDKKKKGKG